VKLGKLVVDVTPLRVSRDFRWLFAARVVSLLSVGLIGATVAMQMYSLTGSSLNVGLVSACLAVPMVVGLLVGGVLADRHDRRILMVATRGAYVIVVAGFLANALAPQPQVAAMYSLAAIAGLVNGLSVPPLMAAMPAVVGRELVVAAAGLTAVTTQLGAVVGPAMAGVIVSTGGFASSYTVILAGAVLVPLLLARVRALPVASGNGEGSAAPKRLDPLRSLADAFRFIVCRQLIAGLLLVDLAATMFAMPHALFPELGARRFGGDATIVGWLYAAPAAGALIGAVASGWTGRVNRPGAALIGAVLLWGVGMIGAGASAGLAATLTLLAVAGFGQSSSEILRRGLLQVHTPDELQGRVGSLWAMQAISGPAVGNVNAGLLSRVFPAGGALVAGGLLCVAGTVAVATSLPALRRATFGRPAESDAGDAPPFVMASTPSRPA